MAKIRVLDGQRYSTIEAKRGENYLAVLRAHGFAVAAPCGGKGTCGKCKIRIVSGAVTGAAPDARGYVLACGAGVLGDAEIVIAASAGGGLETSFHVRPIFAGGNGYAAACDIGTTTLAAELVEIGTGEISARVSRLNPQLTFGADVISRIQASADGHLAEMQTCVLRAVREMVAELSSRGDVPIGEVVIAGNTTMQHLFAGVDPTPIGRIPFAPVFTDSRTFDGETLQIDAERVTLLPSASGYFGADAVAGLYAVGMDEGDGTRLFVDIGTNGEIALRVKGKLFCASTAAGPALEGACIECGVGGIKGAVDRVRAENGALKIRTIANAEPVGVCGCGLVDLIAELLRSGVIDETGALIRACPYANARVEGDRFVFGERLWLSQKDIRQFQLAKSAVHAGIVALLYAAGIAAEDVEEVMLAGGLGYYLDIDHALEVGLLPRALAGKIRAVGNTSLHGAALAASNVGVRDKIARLAAACEIVELNESPVFSDEYMMGMMFASEEE